MPQTSERMADLIVGLSGAPAGRAVGDVAEALGISVAACQRLLASALDAGFVVREGEAERYRLSPRLWGWGVAATQREQQISQAARNRMIDVARRLGETLLLSVLHERDVLFLVAAGRRNGIVVVEPVSGVIPAHACAPGKAMLAYLPEERLEPLLGPPLERFTEHTITSIEALRTELDHVGHAGYAMSRGEYGPHAAIAVPILGAEGEAIAAVSVTGDLTDDSVRRLESLALVLRRLGETLSSALGASAGRRAAAGTPGS